MSLAEYIQYTILATTVACTFYTSAKLINQTAANTGHNKTTSNLEKRLSISQTFKHLYSIMNPF